MALKEFKPNRVLNLAGEEGNAFYLMSIAQNNAKKLGKDADKIIKEMTAADYGNLVYVFNREFGDYFEIVLPHNMTIESVEESYRQAQEEQAA